MSVAPTPKTSTQYFEPLTGVRAIAAYMVFLHHYNPFPEEKFAKVVHGFVEELHVGVNLFFVLSGFLIAYRYAEMKKFSFKTYLINRIARIYPMYFLLTILTFLAIGLSNSSFAPNQWVLFFLNISFLRGFFDHFKFSGIAQGWSLTVEETFYFLAPIIFMLIKRNNYFYFWLPLLFVLLGLGLVGLGTQINFYGFFQSQNFLFWYTFPGRCFEFFIGIGLAFAYRHNWIRLRFNQFTYLGIVIIILGIYGISVMNEGVDFQYRSIASILIGTILLPMFGVAVFYYGLLKEKTRISGILGSRLFILLGKSSYIFYLIHIGVIATGLHFISQNPWFLFFSLNLISIALFKLLEDPFNSYIRKRFTRGNAI